MFIPEPAYSVSVWSRFLEFVEFDFQSLNPYFSISTAFEEFTGAKAKIGCLTIHLTCFVRLHLKQSRWQGSARSYSQDLPDQVDLWSWDPRHITHPCRQRLQRSAQRHKLHVRILSSTILYLKFLTFLRRTRSSQKYLCRTLIAADCFAGLGCVLHRKQYQESLLFYRFKKLERLGFTSWVRINNQVCLKMRGPTMWGRD